jgi:hypothetical protein
MPPPRPVDVLAYLNDTHLPHQLLAVLFLTISQMFFTPRPHPNVWKAIEDDKWIIALTSEEQLLWALVNCFIGLGFLAQDGLYDFVLGTYEGRSARRWSERIVAGLVALGLCGWAMFEDATDEDLLMMICTIVLVLWAIWVDRDVQARRHP